MIPKTGSFCKRNEGKSTSFPSIPKPTGHIESPGMRFTVQWMGKLNGYNLKAKKIINSTGGIIVLKEDGNGSFPGVENPDFNRKAEKHRGLAG